jgi:ribonuclease HI
MSDKVDSGKDGNPEVAKLREWCAKEQAELKDRLRLILDLRMAAERVFAVRLPEPQEQKRNPEADKLLEKMIHAPHWAGGGSSLVRENLALAAQDMHELRLDRDRWRSQATCEQARAERAEREASGWALALGEEQKRANALRRELELSQKANGRLTEERSVAQLERDTALKALEVARAEGRRVVDERDAARAMCKSHEYVIAELRKEAEWP